MTGLPSTPDTAEVCWDILATSGPTRICQHCGITAREASLRSEPICSNGGLVGPHSFLDIQEHLRRQAGRIS